MGHGQVRLAGRDELTFAVQEPSGVKDAPALCGSHIHTCRADRTVRLGRQRVGRHAPPGHGRRHRGGRVTPVVKVKKSRKFGIFKPSTQNPAASCAADNRGFSSACRLPADFAAGAEGPAGTFSWSMRMREGGDRCAVCVQIPGAQSRVYRDCSACARTRNRCEHRNFQRNEWRAARAAAVPGPHPPRST